jgi:hypothetical protein
VVPQYRNSAGAIDVALCNRSAVYGVAVEFPGPQNIQRQYFGGAIAVEEVPP